MAMKKQTKFKKAFLLLKGFCCGTESQGVGAATTDPGFQKAFYGLILLNPWLATLPNLLAHFRGERQVDLPPKEQCTKQWFFKVK